MLALVPTPQSLTGLEQETVSVCGHLQILGAPADLEYAPSTTRFRHESNDPDRLYEEVLSENTCQYLLVYGRPSPHLTELDKAIARRRLRTGSQGHIVLAHEAVGGIHGRGCLVLIVRVRERK